MNFLPYVSGGLLGWSLGANDTANAFGLAVATRTVDRLTAVLLTAVFAMAGAYFGGYPGIRNLGGFAFAGGVNTPMAAFFVMLAAFGALMILLALAVPSSISQGVIGAILGWGLCMGTADFSAAAKFFVSWVVTPVAGGLVCFLLCKFVRRFLENKILGLGHYDLILRIGFFAAGIFGAWSMGANAVANVTGVYGGPLGLLDEKTAALLGGALIALGALTFSRRTMHTVGSRITQLSPLSGLLAVCSYALIVFLYSLVGIPVSGSQAVVGAVIGAGLSKGVGTVDLGVLKNILSAWAITPAAAGGLAFAFGHIYLHFM